MSYTQIASTLPTMDLTGKRIFLRADLNMPLGNENIGTDHKLRALVPTIKFIQKRGGKILLATHIGRPKEADQTLSTQHLLPWFKEHGLHAIWARSLEKAKLLLKQCSANDLVLLENLRFWPGETTAHAEFAQQLADLADIYVNDAFGVLHRTDTSVQMLPQLFQPNQRTIGLLVERELQAFAPLTNTPGKPFVLIIGGAKAKSKIPLLAHLLDIVDTILLCPAVVFTFMRAMGKPVGKSLVDEQLFETAQTIVGRANGKQASLVFPVDFQVAQNEFAGPLSHTSDETLHATDVGMSIGPQTAQLFATHIKNGKNIFFNGVPGDRTRIQTLEGARSILQAMATANGYAIAGGGDTVAAAELLGLHTQLDYCSTGGGAALTLLAQQPLPALVALVTSRLT